MVLRSFSIRPSAIAVVMVFMTACGPSDPSPPWDTEQMVRELTSELRQFEGLATNFDQVEVLAWRVDAQGEGDRIVEIALLWGRTGPANAPTGWALVQGYRHPDAENIWRRSLFNRDLRWPLNHLRPGEDPDGTWHAYRRYGHAPTVREICDFAAVEFFNAGRSRGHQRVRRSCVSVHGFE